MQTQQKPVRFSPGNFAILWSNKGSGFVYDSLQHRFLMILESNDGQQFVIAATQQININAPKARELVVSMFNHVLFRLVANEGFESTGYTRLRKFTQVSANDV